MSKTIKRSFPVTGMTCASCAATVEKKLKVQKGITSAAVNYANASAMLEYEPDTNLEQVKKTIQSIGYDIITDEQVTAEDIEQLNQKNYRALRTRTTLAILLSVPLFIIGMLGMHIPYANYIMWALATPIVFLFGKQFFIGAWKQTRHGSANMDTLVALSTGIAYIFSVCNTLYPQYWTSRGMEAQVYFEASGIVISFILLGKLLEDRAKSSTSSAIKKLMGLQPETVTRATEKGEEIISLSDVMAGDILIVKPGDKIAVDGAVTSGTSYVDEHMISGEPMAVVKAEGAKVFAGTINQKGSFRFRAEKVGKDTLLANIIKKVQEAQGSKAPVQKQADKIAGIFVPVVVVIAIATFVTWMIVGGEHGLEHGLLAMVTVMVIACPCALGLATPTAIIAGIGKGAENGILIKDAESLETIPKVNAMVFDKTGTITEGTPEVVDIAWLDDTDTAVLSSVLYSIELLSEHPLADAITSFYKALQVPTVEVKSFSSITGSGVTALYGRTIYFAGSSKLLKEMNIPIPELLNEKVKPWMNGANSIVWLANQSKALAAIAISDKIKLTSFRAVKTLEAAGIDVYMLTGDNQHTAYIVAEQAGITRFTAEMSPNDKANFIAALQKEGKIVGMAGDGINDSQALAQADVSIAMGAGTDIAMDVAKMTLLSSDLNQIPKAITLAHKTVRLIKQNLFWAFIYNIIAIPVAAGALYPINGFLLNPMIAGAAMAMSSVSVVSNGLRLKWTKL